jgi:site-specific DNA-methyltransferase (adenine-specific)
VEHIVEVFREVRRVLRADGTLWLNLGDSYANPSQSGGGDPTIGKRNLGGTRQPRVGVPIGLKPKDLVGIPWMAAFALRADGWYLRSEIIWHKPNTMPESVRDRPTKAHEQIFLLSKNKRYFFNQEAVAEKATHAGRVITLGEKSLSRGQANGANVAASGNGLADSVTVAPTRNIRSVWKIATQPYKEAHFATFPEELARRCVLAGTPPDGTVLDPFAGSGTVGAVADSLGFKGILIEAQENYLPLIKRRIAKGVRKRVDI